MKIIIAAFLLLSCFMAKAESISSPSGNITLEFSINERGIPTYQVTYKGIPVIKPSTLGIELNEENSLMDSFRINNTSTSTFDETWEPVWGENSHIRNRYNDCLLYTSPSPRDTR